MFSRTRGWLLLLLIVFLIGCLPATSNDVSLPPSSSNSNTISNTKQLSITPSPWESDASSFEPVDTLTFTTATATIESLKPITTDEIEITASNELGGTFLLYTTVVRSKESLDQLASSDNYHAFRMQPIPSFLDVDLFNTFYGKSEYADDMELFFLNFRPQLSPNDRYILVPGLASYPEYGIEGTGTWLLDLEASTVRQLLPDGVIATWNPTSDAITYVDGDTLYKLSVAEGAVPTPIFQDANLSPLYAKWSPDGQWIATLTSEDPESVDLEEPKYAAAYWLVPVNGGSAHKSAVREAFAIEYVSSDMSWSPDGQYLLVRGEVFDLQGNLRSPDYPGGVAWLPNDARLLLNSREGLRIITIAGEELAHISDTYASQWAFSHDGKLFAYTRDVEGEPTTIAVYNMERGESRVIGSAPATLLRWNADDNWLIVGVFQDDQYEIWLLEPRSDGAAQRLLENAELIEAVPYPSPVP